MDNEQDVNYKNLVQEELVYIRKNGKKIEKRANTIYHKKKAGNTEKVMEYCLDYDDLERMHDEWLKFIGSSDIL